MNNVLLKNGKYKVVFTEAYLEPSQTPFIELYCDAKMLSHRCLTGF